ncbi:porin [Porticoccus sp.]
MGDKTRHLHARDKQSTHLRTTAVALLMTGIATPALAELKLQHSDDLWISVGGGIKFEQTSRQSDTDDSNEFNIASMRTYWAGQLNEYLKWSINTEKYEGDSVMMIDAIAQFDVDPAFRLWVGRTLVPTDRPSLNGPYSSLSWNQYRQPLFPAGYDGPAGRLGRSEGAVAFGTLDRVQYTVGIFEGAHGENNDDHNLLYAGRIAYNFLNVESLWGYYTGGTYYGKQGNILTAAVTLQSQKDATGSEQNPGDFLGYAFDIFSETVLDNNGVTTFEAGYKNLDSDYTLVSPPQDGLADCFCLFEGKSYYATAGYLFPQKMGLGQFQPYMRYTKNDPDDADSSDTTEWGVNYVINGNKATVNLHYVTGDANASGYAGGDTDVVSLGLMLQYY